MSADIKTISDIESLKRELASVNAQLFPSNAHLAMESALTCIEQLQASIAVLEAAPASSAMAMQAVDVPLMAHKLNKCKLEENHRSHERTAYWCTMYRELCEEIIDALQSQQSPVQASEPINDAARRYEIVRKLNVHQFSQLYNQNIAGQGNFDDLVDQFGKQASDAGRQG